MTDHRLVAKWLVDLSLICSSAEPVSREKIVKLVEALGDQYPDAAYTAKSREHVAGQSPFWPAYADLVKRLGEWWRDHKPADRLALGDGRLARMEPLDRRWVAYFYTRQDENFGAVREGERASSRELVLSLLCSQSKPAYAYLMDQQMPARVEPSEADRERVRASLASLYAGLGRTTRQQEPTPHRPLPEDRLRQERDGNPLVTNARAAQARRAGQ